MANEMDQFKNMPKEPQLSDKENLEEANKRHQEEEVKASSTIESTKEGSQDLLGRLNPNEKEDIARIRAMEEADNNEGDIPDFPQYESITTEHIIDEDQEVVIEKEGFEEGFEESLHEKSRTDTTDKVRNDPNFPIIKRLKDLNIIQKSSYETIVEAIANKDKNQELNLEDLILADNIDMIKGHLEQSNNEQNNIDNFTKDYPDLVNESENTGLQNEANYVISKYYVKLEGIDVNNDIDKKENLLTAINTATNHLLTTIKDLPIETQTFKNAIIDIHSGNMKKALEGFESLYLLSYGKEGISARGMEISKKAIKQSANNKIAVLQERYQEIQAQLLQVADKNTNDILIQELELIVLEAKEIDNGEVFYASEVDVLNEGNIGETKEQTT